MDRRTFVRSLAVGAVAASAGCLGDRSATGTPTATSDESVEFHYPHFPPTYYSTRAERATDSGSDSDATPREFASLSADARLEFAIAVHRDRYVSGRSPLLHEELDRRPVDYRGRTFDVGVSVVDAFQEAEHGPEADPNWVHPVAVEYEVGDGELSLSITNRLDVDLPYHHLGRPHFGVVTAVADSVTVLDHERYGDNEFVTTDELVRTEDVYFSQRTTTTLAPGDSLRETYRIPDGLSGEATVPLPLWLGDESIVAFGNRRTLVNARLSVEF